MKIIVPLFSACCLLTACAASTEPLVNPLAASPAKEEPPAHPVTEAGPSTMALECQHDDDATEPDPDQN